MCSRAMHDGVAPEWAQKESLKKREQKDSKKGQELQIGAKEYFTEQKRT